MPKRILITGATGLIGTHLTRLLIQRNDEVIHLGRSPQPGNVPSYRWDVKKGVLDERALDNIDGIVHLAGAGIADKRWSPERKKEIIDSRVQSTLLLRDYLARRRQKPEFFISASAIGYYGFADQDQEFTEATPAGTDYLAHVTTLWEATADSIAGLDIRVVKVRTGIVLSKDGGVLKSMALPIRFGLGAPLGTGRQYLSWIHIDDLCNLYLKMMEDSTMAGPYNAVAPTPVTNHDLTQAIAGVLKRPLWLPRVPAGLLRLVLGEMANLVITGSRVSPARIMATGFRYQFPDLNAALNNLLLH